MNLKLIFLLVVVMLTPACVFVPTFSKSKTEVPEQCKLITKEMELGAVGLNVGNSCQGAEEACLLALIGIPAASFVVSGSVVLTGNTLHWLEYEGRKSLNKNDETVPGCEKVVIFSKNKGDSAYKKDIPTTDESLEKVALEFEPLILELQQQRQQGKMVKRENLVKLTGVTKNEHGDFIYKGYMFHYFVFFDTEFHVSIQDIENPVWKPMILCFNNFDYSSTLDFRQDVIKKVGDWALTETCLLAE